MTTSVRQCIVETAQSEAQGGERDSVPERARKKVRFAERVAEQTPEGTVTAIAQSTSSSSTSSPTTIATSMQVDASDQDRSKNTQSCAWDRHGIGGACHGR